MQMINEQGEKMVEHHTHYKEIQGYDKTIWLTDSEHKKLHKKLRKNNECNIPVDMLRNISKSAHARTEKGKKTLKNYRISERGKKTKNRYSQSDKSKQTRREYDKNNIQYIHFYETPGPNTQLHERIRYNHKTGTVIYNARYDGLHNYTLPVIDI